MTLVWRSRGKSAVINYILPAHRATVYQTNKELFVNDVIDIVLFIWKSNKPKHIQRVL